MDSGRIFFYLGSKDELIAVFNKVYLALLFLSPFDEGGDMTAFLWRYWLALPVKGDIIFSLSGGLYPS